MGAFGDIKKGAMTTDMENDNENKLAEKIKEFNSSTKPRSTNMAKEKSDVINNVKTLLKGMLPRNIEHFLKTHI